MKRILVSVGLCSVILSALCVPACAEEAVAAETVPWLAHWAITLFGMGLAARLAWQAFGHEVVVGNLPTFPFYMTSRRQYWFGASAFASFACGFFLLLVQQHEHVIELVKPLNILSEDLVKAVSSKSASYLAIVVVMAAVYLYCLQLEKPWNVLLMMRDVIQSWISVPQLAKRLMAEIQFHLRVPADVIPKVVAASGGLVLEQDFYKDINTPDRKWAEISYMRWWMTQDAGGNASFFAEASFAFDTLTADADKAAPDMRKWKSAKHKDRSDSKFPQTVSDLHTRFARLVACYLIYRNGSRRELAAEASRLGIGLPDKPVENPVRYWIVYMIALVLSVYFGVHVSSFAFDLFAPGGGAAQDPNIALKWAFFSMSNFGVAIIVILMLRMVASMGNGATQSHLLVYCWTFAAAFLAGPTGLTVAAHFFGPPPFSTMPIYELFYTLLMWGLAPGMVSVYISYYLDRQTYADLPNIVHSPRTIAWRLLNCFGFATAVIFVLLPQFGSVQDTEPGLSVEKLRFVAGATTFCIVLGLALAAQFALRKPSAAGALVGAPELVH
jgi:hypothetical protein